MLPLITRLRLNYYLYCLRSVCYPPLEKTKELIRIFVKDKEIQPPDVIRTINDAFVKKDCERIEKEFEETEKKLQKNVKNRYNIDESSFILFCDDMLASGLFCVDNKMWVYKEETEYFSYGDRYRYNVTFSRKDKTLRSVNIVFPACPLTQAPGEASIAIDKYIAFRDILRRCANQDIPSKEELRNFFSDKIYRYYSNNQALQPEHKTAVLIMYEALRQKINDYLEKYKVSDIMKTKQMRAYLAENKNSSEVSDLQNVRDFLKGHSDFLFKYAESIGLIKKGMLIPQYKDIRDNVRHPEKPINNEITPQKVYENFCTLLTQKPNYTSPKYIKSFADECKILAEYFHLFNNITENLDKYVDPKFKKGEKPSLPKGWVNNLIEQGILSEEQKVDFNNYRHKIGAIAHGSTRPRKGQPYSVFDHDVLLKNIRKKLIDGNDDFYELCRDLNEKAPPKLTEEDVLLSLLKHKSIRLTFCEKNRE